MPWKRKILLPVVAYLYAALFTYTAVYKLIDLPGFRSQLTDSPVVGPFTGVLTWLIPNGELVLSVALIIPRFRLRGMLAGLILLALFTAYFSVLMIVSPSVSCSCGGLIERMGPAGHLLFNSGFILAGVIAIIAETRSQISPKILRA